MVLLAAFLFFMPAVLHAQLQKKNLLLEGSFAYFRGMLKYSTTNYGQIPMDVVSQRILFAPMAGLLLTGRLLLSGGIILNRSSHKKAHTTLFLLPDSQAF